MTIYNAEYILSDGSTRRITIRARSLQSAAKIADESTPPASECIGLFTFTPGRGAQEYHTSALRTPDGEWWRPDIPFVSLRNVFTGQMFVSARNS